MHTVYVLKSLSDGNLYIGCTSDIENRLKLHRSGKVRSTKSRLPVELIYSENFTDKYEAFFTERLYKSAKGKRELLKKIK